MDDARRNQLIHSLEATAATLGRVIARADAIRAQHPYRTAFADNQILDAERQLALVDAQIATLGVGGHLNDSATAAERWEWATDVLESMELRLRGPAPRMRGLPVIEDLRPGYDEA